MEDEHVREEAVENCDVADQGDEATGIALERNIAQVEGHKVTKTCQD